MAYDEEVARRIRTILKKFPEDFSEKKMFGGLSFLYRAKMIIGIIKDELAVRVLERRMDSVLRNGHARPMDFTKRPMKEFVYVSPKGFETEAQLQRYIDLGLEHAISKL